MKIETISVVGLGYIGLPTAAVFASRKINVIGVDVNQHAVDTINRGEIHIVEPQLDIVVNAAVTQGYLKATTQPETADAFIVAVPTPFIRDEAGNYHADLSYIEKASLAIAPVLKAGNLVVLESTSPIGATEQMATWLAEARPDLTFPQSHGEQSDIRIAHCPERVLPGYVLQELVSNDRVIGGISAVCSEKAADLYKTFVRGECIITNARTAEMAKLTENSFRDVNIAFANELSTICDKLNINVWELTKLANRHPRVNILNSGPGVGGHCIAVDPWFIVDSCPEQALLIKQARLTNDAKPHYVINQIREAADQFKRPIIACLGLAFKADIDDLRESPALQIVTALSEEDIGEIIAVEPNIKSVPKHLEGKVELASLQEAVKKANVIVVLVDHKEFKSADKTVFAKKVVIDTRGIF